jgi:starch-binding outer membrane protein, SusD/RagB family
MNIYKLKIFAVILLSIGMTSCINDLNVEPIDPNLTTSKVVYTDVNSYKQGLAKLYAAYAVSGQRGPSDQPDIAGIDEGFGSYMRAYWNCQELPTDEAVIAWNDQTVKDFHWHTWSPSDVFITAMYSRVIYTATLCNEYIRVTTGNEDPEIKRFHAEARFLRALAYYHGLDLFGNIPFVTEADNAGAFFPKQIQRADLFTYIDGELSEIESEMGEPRFEYARADKGALWMLQAKLYLNAKVYIGQDKYTECLTALNKLLASSYSLEANYKDNFVADNNNSSEIIFPITSDGSFTRVYGGTTYLIHAAIGGTMSPSEFGVGGGWGGLRTTSALVDKFPGSGDDRAMFWSDGQTLDINDIGQFVEGYAITKFSNLTSTGEAAPHAHPDFVDTDYPMFRLADAYLMYAEAVLRNGSGGSAAQALAYVNELRERAYGDTSGNITSGELTLDFILDERARELYWEGHRRTDLIRFDKFTGGDYLWPWKGKIKEGTSTPSYRNLYPIPSNDLGANPNLKQNDGY